MKGKLRNFKKFLISILMMTTIVVMGATVYAAPETLELKASASGPIWFDDGTVGNWYCREKGKPAVFYNEAGEVIETTEYELLTENMQMEPMTGYAYYKLDKDGDECGTSTKREVQNIIWSSNYISNHFGFGTPTVVEPDSTMAWFYSSGSPLNDEQDKNGNGILDEEEWEDILKWAEDMTGYKTEEELQEWYDNYDPTTPPSEFFLRVQQYGRVHYGIFKRSVDGLLYKTETKKEDLMVLVDQISGQYTVGPYTMKLTCDDTYNGDEDFEKAKLALYNELIGEGNVGYTEENCFVKKIEIEGLNKKEGTDVVLINSLGEEIKFPNFKAYDGTTNETEEFYFRFTPDNDGQIPETGDPEIHIKYLFDFADCEVQRYKLEKVTDVMAVGDGKDVKEMFYEVFEAWYESNIKVDEDHNGANSTYTYYVNGTLVFKDIKVKIKNSRITIEVEVDDVEQTFDSGNNSYVIEKEDGTLHHHTADPDVAGDTDYDWWTYPGAPEITDEIKAALKEQCEKIIDAIELEYDYEDQDGDLADNVQKCSLIGQSKYNDGFHLYIVDPHWVECVVKFPGKEINEKLGGHVWYEGDGIKTGEADGKYNSAQDKLYAGMQVTLWEQKLDGSDAHIFTYEGVANPTVTDENGEYKFEHLNPLRKYYVKFLYNGEYYQSTYYKYNLMGGYSNAMDVDREGFNHRFTKIEADPEAYNYNGYHAAYAKESRLMRDDGSFIAGDYVPTYSTNYVSDCYKGALLYIDAWEYFRDAAVATKSYDGAYAALQSWLTGQGVGATETANVIQFMKDCMIESTTNVKDPIGNYNCEGQEKVVYPVYNRFVLLNEEEPPENIETVILDETFYYLYTKKSDQSRYVDYGIDARVDTQLYLYKDVYKSTIFLNGQKEEYFSARDGSKMGNPETWTVKMKSSDGLYNGLYAYRKYLKAADVQMDATATYGGLFDGNQADKNLDVLVTYRIDVGNFGSTVTSIDEIVDYYDADNYIFDGKLVGNNYESTVYTNYKDTGVGEVDYYYINKNVARNATASNIDYSVHTGSDKNVKNDSIKVSEHSSQHKDTDSLVDGDNYNYKPIYITFSDNVLKPTEYISLFITFKATDPDKKIEEVKGLDLLDEDLNGNETIGKRNIAEINGYSTYYNEGQLIPDYLDKSDKPVTKNVSGKEAGIVDQRSKVGSLAKWDLDNRGLIKDGDKALPDNSTTNRQEDDTCAAPPFKLLIDGGDEGGPNVRKVKGFTFEDARTVDENKAKVGNGVYKDSDKDIKIDGITVQLVELVREVDELNQFTGKYVGEYIWSSEIYDENGNCTKSTDNDYWSGKGSSKVIINGPKDTILYVPEEDLGKAEYSFTSIPAGDFYIRFIYGENVRTVLTDETDEAEINLGTASGEVKNYKLKDLQHEVNDLVGAQGYNGKSYNGQDYKSTVYQAGINQNPLKVNGQELDNYHGIKRYTNIDGQNHINSIDNPAENRHDGNDYSIENFWTANCGKIANINTGAMYMYNIGDDYKTANVSDAKDVYAYRERANRYSETVQNYKAEVLSSFERLATYDTYKGYSDEATKAELRNIQIRMLNELMQNTYMVAQSGVMDLEIEADRVQLVGQKASQNPGEDPNKVSYVIDDVDLGLVERPEAGLKIKKEVTRFQVVLANGETLFDTEKSVNNVFFAKHVGHITGYESLRMKKPQIGENTKNSPRVIQVYMDDEIMTGSKVTITYKYTVTNVGEVDYTSKNFYYIGKKADSDNIVKTNASKVVDYLTNYLKYQSAYQENPSDWAVAGIEKLMPSTTESGTDASKIGEDFINRTYYKDVITYNSILTTEKLGKELLPEIADKNNSTATVSLIAGTTISGDGSVDGLLYNNLAEIVQVKNTVGRRMQYSRVGNQPMANQGYGDDTDKKYNTSFDLVTPTEIDADSAQLVRILPPTGENKQYAPIIIAAVGVVMILGIAIVVIRKKVLNSNAK